MTSKDRVRKGEEINPNVTTNEADMCLECTLARSGYESDAAHVPIGKIVQAFLELTTSTGTLPAEDPLKMEIMRAFSVADKCGKVGLTVPELVELLICRELTPDEEDFIILHTEPPQGHA